MTRFTPELWKFLSKKMRMGRRQEKERRKGKKIQEKTKKKNREKTRDQEATFVEIRRRQSQRDWLRSERRQEAPPSPLSFFFLFPFYSPSPSSWFRDLHKQSPEGKTAEKCEDREECGRSWE